MSDPEHGNEKDRDVAFRDYGWENGWSKVPEAVEKCQQAKHITSNIDIGPPFRGINHMVTCPICKIRYHYDSSD
jgi:hypothetical protein